MTMPPVRPAAGRGSVVLRVFAGIVAALAGLIFLFSVSMSLSSRFGWNDRDLHGYGLIFGTFLAILAGFVLALVVPLVLGPARRARAYAVSMPAFAVVSVLLIVVIVTA